MQHFGLPDADLVNAHMLEKQARAEFGKLLRHVQGASGMGDC